MQGVLGEDDLLRIFASDRFNSFPGALRPPKYAEFDGGLDFLVSRGPENTKNHRKSILRVFCLLLVPLALTWPRWICAESLDFLPLVP